MKHKTVRNKTVKHQTVKHKPAKIDGVKTALLFGGQGDRTIHAALRRGLKQGSFLLEHALRACNCTHDQLLHGSGRLLTSSQVLQPLHMALLLMDAIRFEEQGIAADYLAGHSLGELAAWACAGALSFEDAIDLAAVRGRAMSRVASINKGGMLALTDIDALELERILSIGRMHGQLDPAAFNAPREVVLTGTLPALRAVASLCESRRLNVEGPWHSPLMEEVKTEFAEALAALCLGKQERPVVSGLNGFCLHDPEKMPASLLSQLTRPVRWTAALQTLTSLGVERFVVAGPGRVLRYLVRQNLPWTDVIAA